VSVRAAAPVRRHETAHPVLPAPPPATVRRVRLERLLDRHATRAVTVVSAPPGSGKTVLLSAWAQGRRAAWISLGPEHLDVARLWRDLDAALRPVGIELGSGPAPSRASAPDLADRIRAALDCAEGRPSLVLDDLHLVRGPALSLVAALAAECGERLGLAVASRSDPDLSLGRLRVEGRLGEVRAADLAFTTAEAAALLAEHDLALRPDQVERLVVRTEGWAAGLSLAALSLRVEPDADAFLAEFTGDDRAVADYLSGEVLALQPPAIRDFLLRTSIAGRLCGGLADALTGGADGARTLAALHRDGVFLSAVDRHERWFRYHSLFAELLRARLDIEHPGLAAELHVRAARWLAAHDLGREALPHALAAGEPRAMAGLLADQWLDLLLGGQAPDAVIAAARMRPGDRRLAVAAAGACLEAGDTARAEAVLGSAPPAAEEDDVRALSSLLRARAVSDAPAARAAAGRVLEHHGNGGRLAVPVDDARRSLALLHLGVTEFAAGSLDAAADALDAASALAVDARRERVLLECLGRSAALELLAGRLTRAETAATSARALACPAGWERTGACAWAYAALAAVYWLRDELADAEAATDAAMTAAYAAAEVPAAHAARLLRGHLAVARGDVDHGRAILRAVVDGLPTTGPVVRGWLDALGPCQWAHEDDDADPLAAAIVRLRRGDPLSALRRVEALILPGVALHPTRRLHALLVAAVARHSLGRSRDASEAVERALEIAAPEGYRRPFADGGGAVRRLLQRHASLPTAYAPVVAELIDALESVSAPPPGLLEPLSERERDVLRLLATLLPNTEIAGELFVSVNTVKTHVKSIYRKLEVSSRREAVARARQMRLI
jgi:LuxR family transcriptional regulator, maltose regulon positive regulatory protein